MKTRQELVSVAADTSGLAAGVTGDTFTLTATEISDGLAHLITIQNNTVTDHSGKTITVTGTGENDRPQTETITGPGASATVTTTKYFKDTITVTPSSTIGADTFDIGWAAGSRGPWFQPDTGIDHTFSVGIGCSVVLGTPTYSLVYSYDKSEWFTHATITGKTVSFDGGVTTPCSAMSVQFTAAGSVTATFIQAASQ